MKDLENGKTFGGGIDISTLSTRKKRELLEHMQAISDLTGHEMKSMDKEDAIKALKRGMKHEHNNDDDEDEDEEAMRRGKRYKMNRVLREHFKMFHKTVIELKDECIEEVDAMEDMRKKLEHMVKTNVKKAAKVNAEFWEAVYDDLGLSAKGKYTVDPDTYEVVDITKFAKAKHDKEDEDDD